MHLLKAFLLTVIFGAIYTDAAVIRSRAHKRRIKAAHSKIIKHIPNHNEGTMSSSDIFDLYNINGKIPDNMLRQILGRARDIVRNKLQPMAGHVLQGIRHSVGKRSVSRRRRQNTVEIDAETLALLLAAHGENLDEILAMIVSGMQDSTATALQESLSNVLGSTDYIAIAHAIG